MKAVAVMAAGDVRIVELPDPRPKPYECLVRVEACGFCNATDLKTIHNEIGDGKIPFPIILGHEGVGTIVEAGRQVRNLKVGQRFLNPAGLTEPCPPYSRYWANMVEYAVVQDHAAMDELGITAAKVDLAARPIPSSIPPEDGGVMLALKEAYSAVDNLGFRAGMSVLIVGDGPVGLALTQFMRLRGAKGIVCVGHHDDRLQRLAQIGGADLVINSHTSDVESALGDRRFELAVDAVGSTAIIKQIARRLRPGGTVGLYGVIKKKDSMFDLLSVPNHTSLHILNYPHGEQACHDALVQLVLDGKIRLRDYYSHVLPMERAAEGVVLTESRQAFKVILKMHTGGTAA